jgi:radical SAM protein with 4Fe4S-binding SPASM domain
MESEYKLRCCLWELTLRCTLNCMHCGSVAGVARNKELSIDECYRIADEIIDLGCEDLTFIGGEIFLYKDWEKIARYLSDRNIRVNIMSNGYRINEREIDQIKYAKLTNVGISIDGVEENHNRIRRKNDSFSRILHAFDLLNKGNIPIGVVTCLLAFNVTDLEPLYNLLVKNNVTLWQLQLVNPMGNMADKKDLIIDRVKIPSITAFIKEKNLENKMVVVAADSIGYFDDNESYIRGRRTPICYWEGCQSGISCMYIDSVGNVKGCGALYDDVFIEGNVRETPLKDIWNDENKFVYNRKFNKKLLTGLCSNCEIGDVCKGGCRASNYFTTKSLFHNAFCSRNATVNGKSIGSDGAVINTM